VQKGKEAWIYLPAEKRAFHAQTAIEDPAQYGDALRELKRAQERARTVGGLKVTEHPDRLAEGRAVRVTEVEMDYEKHVGRPPEGNGSKTIRWQIVVDALTGRLVKWEQSGYTATTIAYDQPLPDHLFTWKPPAGAQVTEIADWWEERLGRTLATAQSRSWDLTIHAVDVAANGDIWLTASWQFQDPQFNTWGTTGAVLQSGEVTSWAPK
jgi:hypothetical protein